MSTIRTAIELEDNFTGVLYSIINSVNLGLSAMEDLHRTMSAPVDTTSLEAAKDLINQATIAVQQLDAAKNGVDLSTPESPATPVQWQTDTMDVFNSTGIMRFQQEVQSTNNMLNTLNQTQSRIARTAEQTNLFPAGAIADMNNMQNRLQAIQQRIQVIERNPANIVSPTASAELEQLRGQLNQALQEQQNLNRAVDNMDVQAANEAYLRLSQTVGNTERYIRDNTDEQGRFNNAIGQGTQEANQLTSTIKGAIAAYATVRTLSNVLNLSDQLTSTTARLDLMNDGLQSTQDLQNMIYLSAERSRGSYQATADAVSKLGLMAGNAFGSSEEIIAFMEQVNKQFTIAGTEASGIDAAMLQLTQAMGSGVLRGEEYNSILEQAPNIIQNIAKYIEQNEDVLASVAAAMGMEVEELAGNVQGNLKDIAGEGIISAELVKAAMFAAADETNAKFESMPQTFSQIWTSFQNTALMAFQPVLQRLNQIANSEAFQGFVNNAIEALSMVASIALEILNFLIAIAGAVGDNWSWLSPIIYGVAAALIAYYTALGVYNGIQAVSNGIKAAAAMAEKVHAASLAMESGATFTATAAQYGFNAALLACPLTWIIIIIIALIAIVYAAVAAVNHFAGTSVSATGIICGAFMVALAFIGNIFVALWNLVVDVFVLIYNLVATVANFIGNVFTDPIGAVCRLFFDLADIVLGVLQALASAIDAIFGSNLAGSVQGWRDSLGGWVDDTFGKGKEVMAKMDADSMKLGRFEYGAAWDAGYSFGESIDESIAEFDPSTLFDTNVPSPEDYSDLSDYGGMTDIGSGVGDIAENTGKIADTMEITAEDLKYLRDIAEQETVNRFTTAEITIEQTNHNNVSGKMDLDGIVSGLTDAANEAVAMITEGVHE